MTALRTRGESYSRVPVRVLANAEWKSGIISFTSMPVERVCRTSCHIFNSQVSDMAGWGWGWMVKSTCINNKAVQLIAEAHAEKLGGHRHVGAPFEA